MADFSCKILNRFTFPSFVWCFYTSPSPNCCAVPIHVLMLQRTVSYKLTRGRQRPPRLSQLWLTEFGRYASLLWCKSAFLFCLSLLVFFFSPFFYSFPSMLSFVALLVVGSLIWHMTLINLMSLHSVTLFSLLIVQLAMNHSMHFSYSLEFDSLSSPFTIPYIDLPSALISDDWTAPILFFFFIFFFSFFISIFFLCSCCWGDTDAAAVFMSSQSNWSRYPFQII